MKLSNDLAELLKGLVEARRKMDATNRAIAAVYKQENRTIENRDAAIRDDDDARISFFENACDLADAIIALEDDALEEGL